MLIFFAIIAVIFLILILIYNGLINKKNKAGYAFSGVDVMLKKRHDLIPNLIETVKQYMNHEKELLTQITILRTKAMEGTTSTKERFTSENQLSALLGQIKIAVENYPNLKASENFLHLQKSLNEIEEQISAARRAYNGSVLDYNNAVEMFPSNMMANMMGYNKLEFFEIPSEEKICPSVKAIFSA